jgi:ATP-dependent DNA helicase RecQ
VRKKKTVKGDTQRETLELYRKGLKAVEIAKQRGLALTTIEGHLAGFVASGEVNVHDFVSEGLLEQVKLATRQVGLEKLTPLKEALGNAISYGQLRIAVSFLSLAGKS